MGAVRKPRTSYSVGESIVALGEVTKMGCGIFCGGSAGSKLHQWAEIADRVSALGVQVSGDGLRRHVADLVKRHKAQQDEDQAPRMRWGMVWPKSDDEIERDRLVQLHIQQLKEYKTTCALAAPKGRASAKASPANVPAKAVPVPVQQPTLPPIPPMSSVQAQQTTSAKRNQLTAIVIDDSDELDARSCGKLHKSMSACSSGGEAGKLELKRRRLEMDERLQSRMLDIQSEQIVLQREQLRLQNDTMRAIAESTLAIAGALHALERRK